MRKTAILVAVGVLVVGAGASWKIQHDIGEVQEELLARATVAPEQAQRTALAAVPGGRIVESEIEEENGRLVYSFELEVQGRDGEVEVEVDAMTGAVLAVESDDDDEDDDDEDDDDEGDDDEGDDDEDDDDEG